MAEEEISLPSSSIHLWLGRISQLLPLIKISQLTSEERTKSELLKSEKAREQFLVSRWSTRQILGRYLGKNGAELEFGVSDLGKPTLLDNSGLSFNRSHSGDHWVLAVSRERAVGVDVEVIRQRRQMDAIVSRWFSEEEQRHFQALEKEFRQAFFFRCWTAREAVLKGSGLGLGHLTAWDQLEKQNFRHHFSPAPDVAGCAACEWLDPEKPPAICLFDFAGEQCFETG